MRSKSLLRCPSCPLSFVEGLETRILFSTLVVNGTANEDVIALGVTNNDGVKVTLNGTTTNYQPGQWTAVTVNTRGANDTVNVTASVVPISIINGGGHDTVDVGRGSLARIAADVTVGSLTSGVGSGTTDLTVDGSNDTAATDFSLTSTSPAGPADNAFGTIAFRSASIRFDATQTSSVTVDGGSGGNSFTVDGIPAGPSTSNPIDVTLNTGSGDDDATLARASLTALTVNGQGGDDTLTVAPFNAGGGTVNFNGGGGSNQIEIIGELAPSPVMPPGDVITLDHGQAKRGDSTLNYTNTQSVQIESGDFQAIGNLGDIQLFVGSSLIRVVIPLTLDVAADQTLGALDIASGLVSLDSNVSLATGSLQIGIGPNPAPGARLDVGTSQLQVHYQGSDPFAQIRAWIFGGAIFSSHSDASHAVGYADSADNVVHGLSSNTVLARFAIDGDANLDNQVNFNDLLLLAQNFGKHDNANWDQCDFNYDGQVNFDELLKLAQNYGKSL